ncbi:DUF5666 domain-containing protein [Crossiella sp. CA198]|uniref:DUF5666 domain-containing protein n=1 Tax=Crossiella sp. CA198 TaxID=3455607 RepID=UPI003F8D4E66
MNEEPLIVPVPEQPPAESAAPRRRGLKALGLVAVIGVAGAAVGAVLLGGLTGSAAPRGEIALAAEPEVVQVAAQDRQARGPKENKQRRAPADSALLLGAVKSVAPGKLTVTRDSGGEVTVDTDARTRVRGNGQDALTGLRAGDRVAVRVSKENKALRVTAPKAHITGTVTRLDGDRATILGQSGLAVPVDLAGIQDKPKVGDLVSVRGAAADGGALLKAERLVQVPAKR